MAKQVLTPELVQHLGLSEHLVTLTKAIENRPHEKLLEPMFHIECEERDEPIYLERQYVQDNQINIRVTYAAGERVLVWTTFEQRRRSNNAANPLVKLVVASEAFLMGDNQEFKRFAAFLRSRKLLDTQSRSWFADHCDECASLSAEGDGTKTLVTVLGNISESPDPDGGFRKPTDDQSLAGFAKRFNQQMVDIRTSPHLVPALLSIGPDQRLAVFRMLCYGEDATKGPQGMIDFLTALGKASQSADLITATSSITNGRDLAKAFDGIRSWLRDAG